MSVMMVNFTQHRRKHDMTTFIIAMMIATLFTARKIAKLKHDN